MYSTYQQTGSLIQILANVLARFSWLRLTNILAVTLILLGCKVCNCFSGKQLLVLTTLYHLAKLFQLIQRSFPQYDKKCQTISMFSSRYSIYRNVQKRLSALVRDFISNIVWLLKSNKTFLSCELVTLTFLKHYNGSSRVFKLRFGIWFDAQGISPTLECILTIQI